MDEGEAGRVGVAHRRVSVLRLLCANLRAEGFAVAPVSSVERCLALLREGTLDALVLDADLLREGMPDGATLAAAVREGAVPLLLVSFDAADRVLARTLGNVPFVSRPDNIDEVMCLVHELLVARPRRAAVAAATAP